MVEAHDCKGKEDIECGVALNDGGVKEGVWFEVEEMDIGLTVGEEVEVGWIEGEMVPESSLSYDWAMASLP